MPNTFTLVATQVSTNMNYVISSNSSFVLSSSFTIPVNPVPNGGPISGGSPFNLGFGFDVYPVTNFLFDGLPVSNPPVMLAFYAVGITGALAAIYKDTNGRQVLVFNAPGTKGFSGPQLYSGTEDSPTMLAGTFILNAVSDPNVYKVNYHFEINGKRSTPDLYNYVSAPSQDYNDILPVIVNNTPAQKGVIVIDGVQIYNQAILS